MSKIIYDPIHKYMKFDSLILKVIDTIEFQRLKNIKQLGLCYHVFPGASHNRFEHSLGVCYLSGLLIETLKINQPELKITDRKVLLIKVAALVHDIGHACYSHFYDHLFLHKKIPNSKYKDHEYRSGELFSKIVKKYNIGILDEEIDFIKKIIDPGKEDKSFIYQIVSNKLNGLDCDRFDYIARDTYNIGLSYSFDCSRLIKEARVINDTICYPKKCYFEISDLYYTRYKLHKEIYSHKTVRGIEYMILDIIKELDKDIKFIEKTENLDMFFMLTDNILELSYFYNNKKAIELYNNIKLRKFYKNVDEIPLDKFDLVEFEKSIKLKKLEEMVIIDIIKLNYSMDDTNPLNFVELYENYEIIGKEKLSFLLPQKFEEKIIKIYVKDNMYLNEVKSLVNLHMLN